MTVSLLNPSYQKTLLPLSFSSSEPPAVPTNTVTVPHSITLRSGTLSSDAASALGWYHRFRGLPTDLPGGYSLMDAGSRINVIANNILRVTQAWGWDFNIGEHRIYQPSHHPWETTERDIGNNVLNDRLIKLVKGDFLSSVFLDGLMQPTLLSKPAKLNHADSFQERAGKLWHNWVRHPFQQAFGLSAHPSVTVGHVLPTKQSHWLKIRPVDTNIDLLQEYGRQLSLQTTFENVQSLILGMPNLLAGKSLPDFSDYLRKGTRVELKKLMVELEPQKSVKPLIVEALAPLFDKQGALVKDAHQQIPQLESVLNYHLSLYQPCGGIEASAQGIKEFLQRLIELPNEATSESTMPGHLPDTQQELAQHLTNDWFSNINKTWRKEADSSIRRTSAEIGQAVLETYNQLWKEINPTLQPGDVNAKPVSAKALAQRFASVTAPTLMSKQGNQSYGKLALILEPAFQLSKRSALLNEYEDHRNKALLAQTVIQALFTCFVLGNLLFFVVFNTFARLDADFQGPNGETRLDFGEMKRGINRWIQRQLGREVTEPTNRTIHPKVSLEYSFGSAAAQFQQKVMGASAAVAPQRSLAAVVNVAPALQPSNYLKQTILNIMPFASAQEERP